MQKLKITYLLTIIMKQVCKMLATLLLIVACAASAYAADFLEKPLDVQRMEGDANIGFSFPADSYHDMHARAGLNMGVALRYNIPNSGFDCGIAADFTGVMRGWDYPGHPEYDMHQTNRILGFSLTGGYNFRQGRKVNPFAEIGIGVGLYDTVGDRLYDVSGTGVLFTPKIGVELWHHLRIYASSHIIRKGFNSLDIGIAVTIGGRAKKH